MANPNAAPVLFDRALLRARHNRALRGKPATFLLDRVADEATERLQAVLRQFKSAADIVGAPSSLSTFTVVWERFKQKAETDHHLPFEDYLVENYVQ